MHPTMQALRERREVRGENDYVLWKELALIVDLLEVVMEGITQTEAALAQLKSDSEARDAATTAALTDLKAEVAKIEATGVDTTAVNATIAALDAAVKTGTSEAAAADPGAQQTPPAQPTTEQVSVNIGVGGSGSAVVNHAPGLVTITGQPSAGTAVLAAVEGQPSQAEVQVSGSTPSTTQTVTVSIAAA